jgi:membrane associated rhomboid family serine protease
VSQACHGRVWPLPRLPHQPNLSDPTAALFPRIHDDRTETTVDRFAGWMSSRVAPHIPVIGASGGACCLMGASVVIQVEELWDTASDLVKAQRRSREERTVVVRRSLVRLVCIGANLLSLASCFAHELQQIKPKRGDRVNHRSHVDGFMIGGALYVAWRYGPRVWLRLKKNRPSSGSGGSSQSIWD